MNAKQFTFLLAAFAAVAAAFGATLKVGSYNIRLQPGDKGTPNAWNERKADFLDKLTEKVTRHKVDVRHLEIEITESMLIDNVEEAVRKLNVVRDMGIGISLDDFGTGYSSLRYLQILPLTTLKIDKSFISNISSSDGVEANITESIVQLVSKLGLDTIAEGVETDDQLSRLKQFNCHTVQGFLKGKPMPSDLCERMLGGDLSALLTIANAGPSSQPNE